MIASTQERAPARLALTAVCLGFVMITLDATIVNLALPAIGAEFAELSTAALQWVVDSYTVALAAFLLTWGAAGDRWGSRRVFEVGTAVFVVASIACAAAGSLPWLVAARAVQGAGAAALLPSSLALIVHQFPDPGARARALGVWGGLSGVGLAAGPMLGGLAVGLADWRLVFAVNVPIGLIAIVLTRRCVTETTPHQRTRLDVVGQVLGTAALACVVAGFIEAGHAGWTDATTLVLIVAGVVAGIAFVVAEKVITAPVLPLGVLKVRDFAVATAIGGLFNFCLYGTLFCLALFLQRVWHLGALTAGLALVPLTLAVGLNAFFSGGLTHRFGSRVPIIAGGLTALAGSAGLALLPHDRAPVPLIVFSLVFGCCSLAMPAMTSLAMNALPGKAGLAAGVLNAARQTGGAVGVALVGGLLPGTALWVVAGGYAGIVLLTGLLRRQPVGQSS
ncbi:DHA2 family efflux MFS transporter permease subunit [Amycolatopsis sp. FDAARGOS 1241]|uniref:DHA2 family efflux MFS transporter permease subunit n=1 Tax=Amycolatopsis sp. FDAARGOS 1241 TaxID=2778070 RepID=UPI00195250F0|nr:DHA2 family efflux MFS transporter permease subunit [Amycolatopsis sp. FDAARGOS 1241]QRP44328.1 DHA2 family efflux MFS transporter permease subunit [Amycolatopsis sp. FDAARGOS 1241]